LEFCFANLVNANAAYMDDGYKQTTRGIMQARDISATQNITSHIQ